MRVSNIIVQSALRVSVTLNYNRVSCLFYAQLLIFNIAQKHAYVAGVIWTLPPDYFRMVLSSDSHAFHRQCFTGKVSVIYYDQSAGIRVYGLRNYKIKYKI